MTSRKLPTSMTSLNTGNQSDIALDDELDELLGDLVEAPGNPNSILKERADKKGNVRLAVHEVSKLLRVLGEIAETQFETGYTLNALAIATRHRHLDLGPSTVDATGLSNVASGQAERARNNAERIRSLFSEITTRPAQPARRT